MPNQRLQLTNSLRSLTNQWLMLPNPRPEHILSFAPHLERSEAVDILERDEPTTQFIGPPLKIRGAEHVYQITRTPSEVRLSYAYCYRRKESYACRHSGVPDKWKSRNWDYRERVSTFSEVNWGDELEWDRSAGGIVFHVLEPQGENPVVKHEITATVDRQVVDLMDTKQQPLPVCEAIDRAILLTTQDKIVKCELLGDELPFAAYNCARCGGGLGDKACYFCKTPVTWPVQNRVDWEHPLPLSIMATITPDFEIHPLQAMRGAFIEWAKVDYDPPLSALQERHQRVITLKDDE